MFACTPVMSKDYYYKTETEPVLTLSVKNRSTEQVQETRCLGIANNTFSWCKQISKVVSKMGRAVSAVKRVSKATPPDVTRQVICALVTAWLLFCDLV